MAKGTLTTVGDVVRGVEISRVNEISKAFLTSLEGSSLSSVVDGMFYTDSSVMLAPVETHGETYFKLGSQDDDISGTYLLSRTGEVFIQGPDGGQLRFVNSGLDSFLQFLEEWSGFVSTPAPLDASGDIDEDVVIEEGMLLKGALERVDEAAFSDEATWWSNVYEEVELGVLGPL
ncbi:SUKH-4 family immunity protein [Streptomyces sp. NPDC048252]|uniref:SUKH-4 family immunity protein n=1 Tax=Streptomyces sp. NPDC048252 TaxID=3154612 RepID=UPI00342628B4